MASRSFFLSSSTTVRKINLLKITQCWQTILKSFHCLYQKHHTVLVHCTLNHFIVAVVCLSVVDVVVVLAVATVGAHGGGYGTIVVVIAAIVCCCLFIVLFIKKTTNYKLKM